MDYDRHLVHTLQTDELTRSLRGRDDTTLFFFSTFHRPPLRMRLRGKPAKTRYREGEQQGQGPSEQAAATVHRASSRLGKRTDLLRFSVPGKQPWKWSLCTCVYADPGEHRWPYHTVENTSPSVTECIS